MSDYTDKIDENLDVWIQGTDIGLDRLDNNSNIKTNFMLCDRNFQRLKLWLGALLSYIRYLRELVDIDSLLKELFFKIQEEKITIPILMAMDVNPDAPVDYTDPFSGTIYFIRRIDVQTVEITAQKENWKVDKLMVTVKDNDGIINYPVVKTSNNRITIYFPDGISSNYQVMLI